MNWENLKNERCPVCNGKLHLRVKLKGRIVKRCSEFADRLYTCGTRECDFVITQVN